MSLISTLKNFFRLYPTGSVHISCNEEGWSVTLSAPARFDSGEFTLKWTGTYVDEINLPFFVLRFHMEREQETQPSKKEKK